MYMSIKGVGWETDTAGNISNTFGVWKEAGFKGYFRESVYLDIKFV